MTGGPLARAVPPTSPLHRRTGGAGRRPRRNPAGAERSGAFQWLVRVGFLSRAVTYGVIGVLAVAIACGAGTAGATPDQQGALKLIAGAPLGFVALAVIAAGLVSYALWKLTQAARGHGPEGGGGSGLGERLANGGGGLAYLAFASIAVRILVGAGAGSSNGAPRRATAGVLAWPGGPWIVGIVGAALMAVAAVQGYYGISERFMRQIKAEEMTNEQRRLFRGAGRVGLTARAVVFGLCAYFLIQSAVTYDPASAVGLDGALSRLHHQTWGPWLLGLVGAGLLVFAAYSLYEARYRRL